MQQREHEPEHQEGTQAHLTFNTSLFEKLLSKKKGKQKHPLHKCVGRGPTLVARQPRSQVESRKDNLVPYNKTSLSRWSKSLLIALHQGSRQFMPRTSPQLKRLQAEGNQRATPQRPTHPTHQNESPPPHQGFQRSKLRSFCRCSQGSGGSPSGVGQQETQLLRILRLQGRVTAAATPEF